MRLISETTGLCAHCKSALPARIVANDADEVWIHKTCPEHGAQATRLSTDAAWYEETRAFQPTLTRPGPGEPAARPLEHGCPFDCGPCELHAQEVKLPVVTITSACNLDCPICYVHNKNDGAYHMPVADVASVLAHLGRGGREIDIVNFTGGEPLLHPELREILRLSDEAGVHRVTVCSNGIRLAKDEALVRELAARGVRIALSFDTFEDDVDLELQGANLRDLKLRCLALLDQYGVDTTLIPVLTAGRNDREIGKILDLAFRTSVVRHVEIHTITFTGQGGTSFARDGRISMVEVLDRIEETTGSLLTRADFVPSPCAHPLCYQVAYLLVDPEGGPPVPFTRFLTRRELMACLSERLYLEPSARLEGVLREAIDRLYAGDDPEAERILAILKRLLRDLFPTDRAITARDALRVAERASKAVYVHSHMDEETFDVERIVQCCDSNCTADGRTVPVCSYNVLYRDKEEHFMMKPSSWGSRRGGVRELPRPGRLPVIG